MTKRILVTIALLAAWLIISFILLESCDLWGNDFWEIKKDMSSGMQFIQAVHQIFSLIFAFFGVLIAFIYNIIYSEK